MGTVVLALDVRQPAGARGHLIGRWLRGVVPGQLTAIIWR